MRIFSLTSVMAQCLLRYGSALFIAVIFRIIGPQNKRKGPRDPLVQALILQMRRPRIRER